MALKMHPDLTVHVGEFLRAEIVAPTGMSVKALSDHLGISRQTLSALLNGSAGLSPEMAIRFEKAFGTRADTLLRMQAAYDLARARRKEQDIAVKSLTNAA
jgi:antitoxin HigA-1